MPGFDYDIIVIGAGAAGISAAKTAAGLGRKTAIVEKNRLGGECTWSGCIPSKAFIHFAGQYYKADAADRGKAGEEAMSFVRKIIERVYSDEKPGNLEKDGIAVIMGEASFTGRNSIIVNNKGLSAGKFIVASGSRPLIPPINGIEKVKYFTNENIFEIKSLPDSLIILGGGAVGIELAQAFSRLGTRVTVVEAFDRILMREDREMSDIISKRIVSEGIELLTGSKAVRAENSERNIGVKLTIESQPGETRMIKASALLVAAGRVPVTDGLGLDEAGIRFSKDGIMVNHFLQTNIPGIYACGDIVGPYFFSHVAGYQGITAGINASIPFKRRMNLKDILWTTYSDPELAHLGLTEEEAHQKYKKGFRIYRVPYSNLDRAKTEGSEEGLAKYIVDRSGRIIGAHIAGKIAGELIHEAQVVRFFRKPLKNLQFVMHAYPSYSDIIRQAARDAYIDGILRNPLVRLARRITGKGRGNSQ